MGLSFYPEHILEYMHVEVGFSQQFLEPVVLNLQITQTLGVGRLHSTKSGAPFVKSNVAKPTLATELLDWHPRFGLFQKADDLFFGKSCSFHIRHSP